MNKTIKKIIVTALSAAMAFSAMAMPASAKVSAPKKVTVYMGGNTNIYINGTTAIKKSSIKSSNKKVAQLWGLDTITNKSTYKYEYFSDIKTSSGGSSNKYQAIYLTTQKPGTSVVSYKIGKKTYKTTVKVMKYTNPVKSITLTGVNGGKNFASKTKKESYADLKLGKATVKNAKLTVKAAKGWYVSSASINYGDLNKGTNRYYSFSGGKKATSFTLGADAVKRGGYLSLNFTNKSNGAAIYISYRLK